MTVAAAAEQLAVPQQSAAYAVAHAPAHVPSSQLPAAHAGHAAGQLACAGAPRAALGSPSPQRLLKAYHAQCAPTHVPTSGGAPGGGARPQRSSVTYACHRK